MSARQASGQPDVTHRAGLLALSHIHRTLFRRHTPFTTGRTAKLHVLWGSAVREGRVCTFGVGVTRLCKQSTKPNPSAVCQRPIKLVRIVRIGRQSKHEVLLVGAGLYIFCVRCLSGYVFVCLTVRHTVLRHELPRIVQEPTTAATIVMVTVCQILRGEATLSFRWDRLTSQGVI